MEQSVVCWITSLGSCVGRASFCIPRPWCQFFVACSSSAAFSTTRTTLPVIWMWSPFEIILFVPRLGTFSRCARGRQVWLRPREPLLSGREVHRPMHLCILSRVSSSLIHMFVTIPHIRRKSLGELTLLLIRGRRMSRVSYSPIRS